MQGSARLLFCLQQREQPDGARYPQWKQKTSQIRLKSLHMDKCACCTDKYKKRLTGNKLIE